MNQRTGNNFLDSCTAAKPVHRPVFIANFRSIVDFLPERF
jgi:hypothetical protein